MVGRLRRQGLAQQRENNFDPFFHAQLGIDPEKMVLDGVLAKAECAGYITIGEAVTQVTDYLLFAAGEQTRPGTIQNRRNHRTLKALQYVIDLFSGGPDLPPGKAFQALAHFGKGLSAAEYAARAGPKRLHNQTRIAAVIEEEQHRGTSLACDFGRNLQAPTRPFKIEGQDNHFRRRRQCSEKFVPGGSTTNNSETALPLQRLCQQMATHVSAVSDEHTYGCRALGNFVAHTAIISSLHPSCDMIVTRKGRASFKMGVNGLAITGAAWMPR